MRNNPLPLSILFLLGFSAVAVSAPPVIMPGWPKDLGVSGQAVGSPMMANIDGLPGDEIASTSFSQFFVWRYDGSVLPGWPVSYGSCPLGPCLGDLNGDGHFELVATHFVSGYLDTTVTVFRDDGTIMPGWPRSTLRGSFNLLLSDLDRDGHPEIIVSGMRDSSGRTVLVFRWDGSPYPWKVPSDTMNLSPPLAIGDLDGDGSPELVAKGWLGKLFAWRSDGSDFPGFPVLLPPGLRGGAGLATADFEGDGRDEILGVAFDVPNFDSLFLFVWNGDGSVRAGWPRYIGIPSTGMISIGDIDGDGEFEILTEAGYLSAFHKDGSPVSGFPKTGFGIHQEVALVDVDPSLHGLEIIAESSYDGEKIYGFYGDGSLIPGYPFLVKENGMYPVYCSGDADADSALEFCHLTVDSSLLSRVYLWKLPGSRVSGNGWPMWGHDRWRTRHYGFIPPDGVSERLGSEARHVTWKPLNAIPNPFTSFTTVRGLGNERFALFDISGRKLGVFKGDRIGQGLPAGVYFLKSDKNYIKPLRIVKLR